MGRALLLTFLILAGCGVSGPAPRHSEAMERSARMLRQLDRLEADLHQGSAETTTYAELVLRHARAEQVACKVSDEHVQEIHRLAEIQQQKIQEKRKKRRAVAMLTGGRTMAAR